MQWLAETFGISLIDAEEFHIGSPISRRARISCSQGISVADLANEQEIDFWLFAVGLW
jgi:hypothetical protein